MNSLKKLKNSMMLKKLCYRTSPNLSEIKGLNLILSMQIQLFI